MTAEKITAVRELLPENSIAAIARKIGVSRGTLYAHMEAITQDAIVLSHHREESPPGLADVLVPHTERG
jgi:transposase-like protein